MLSAANVLPDFSQRQNLKAEDLRHLDEPCVLFEHHGVDSDGEDFFVFTVAGILNGQRLADGCRVGGEVIVINGVSDKQSASDMAAMGLHDTILALDAEESAYQEASAALARIGSVGELERMDLATRADADKSEAFESDMAKIRPLVGDDIVLTTGGAPAAEN